jgi:Lar family restriction alleviation protein
MNFLKQLSWWFYERSVVMKEQIKPCPFCGATAQVIEEVTGFPDELEYFVLCDDLECENRTGPHSTDTAAIAVWNRRISEEG